MTLLRIFLGLSAVFLASCSSNPRHITGEPVGQLSVEEAVRLHMTRPTVIEWLEATNAQPAYFPSRGVWRMNLRDGWILYTEYEDEAGVLWVNAIQPGSDDPQVMEGLERLRSEYEEAMSSGTPQ